MRIRQVLRQESRLISREWWPDFCNWRRSVFSHPEEGSIEDMILQTLRENGSMITRDLRKACGFTGTKMRGKFDTYISRLEMGCYIVTEDFRLFERPARAQLRLGDGRCLPCLKSSWARTAAIPTALPKSRASGWKSTFKDCSRMRTDVYLTSC